MHEVLRCSADVQLYDSEFQIEGALTLTAVAAAATNNNTTTNTTTTTTTRLTTNKIPSKITSSFVTAGKLTYI